MATIEDKLGPLDGRVAADAEDAVAPPPEEDAVEDDGGDADAERGGRAPEPEEVAHQTQCVSDDMDAGARRVLDLHGHFGE